MPVRIVQSKQNARLKELRRALARPGPEPGSLIGIEGPNLLAEALRAGLRADCVFVAEETQGLLRNVGLASDTEVLLVPRGLLDAVLKTETPQPLAALVEAPRWGWADLLVTSHRPPLLVVLAGLQDPGNLGTIARSAEAFGAHGMISLPGTVSAWNQKALRASAGSLLRLPVIAAEVGECFARLRDAGVTVLTTRMQGGMGVDAADLNRPLALVIGNEGNGVPDEIAAQAEEILTIPCPGPVESLNAAVAAGVLLYEASRQRRAALERVPA